MIYFSMLHPNGFDVHNVAFTSSPDRMEIPFENGTVSEVCPGPRTIDIASNGGRIWNDMIRGGGADKCFYFSSAARKVVESAKFTGIDFHPTTVRKIDVPKIMKQNPMPEYWLGRITGHVRAIEIRDEDYNKYPFALDETGLKFVLEYPPGVYYRPFAFAGRPQLTDNTPDFVEPSPMWGWTVLVSERVAHAFKEAKLTGYKLNPLRPGGFCWL